MSIPPGLENPAEEMFFTNNDFLTIEDLNGFCEEVGTAFDKVDPKSNDTPTICSTCECVTFNCTCSVSVSVAQSTKSSEDTAPSEIRQNVTTQLTITQGSTVSDERKQVGSITCQTIELALTTAATEATESSGPRQVS